MMRTQLTEAQTTVSRILNAIAQQQSVGKSLISLRPFRTGRLQATAADDTKRYARRRCDISTSRRSGTAVPWPMQSMIATRVAMLEVIIEDMKLAPHLTTFITDPFNAQTLARHVFIRAKDFVEQCRDLRGAHHRTKTSKSISQEGATAKSWRLEDRANV
jgi:hypothetical protein